MSAKLWHAMYRGLGPFARRIPEEWYLRSIHWASRRCPPVCRPLLVLYRASARFQLSPGEVCALLPSLRSARRFLVFGLGRDSKLWQKLGPAETHFLEHDAKWIEAGGRGIAHVHPVVYRTTIEDIEKGAESGLDAGDLDLHPELELPPEVAERDWDVVLVDGPPGFATGLPGRAQSIRAASKLVRPGGTVAVHDFDRDLEQRLSKRWLGTPTRREGRLGVFRALWEEAPPFNESVPAMPRTFEAGRRPFMDPTRVLRWYSDGQIEITVVNFEEGLRFAPRHEREIVLVRDPWYPSMVARSVRSDRALNRPERQRVLYLSNTEEIHEMRVAAGLDSHFVNCGALIDAQHFAPLDVEKRYDAVMISRFDWFEDDQLKRHYLAELVPRLALLDPFAATRSRYYREHYAAKPNCHFINEEDLPPDEVARVLAQSSCGLILSPLEGLCRASSEYLLCGIPVVSTPSKGGRDVWYDDENSIVVEPDEVAVAEAVATLVRERRDPHRIRARYLERAAAFRERLIRDVLEPVMRRYGADLTARELVETVPFPWWPQPTVVPKK